MPNWCFNRLVVDTTNESGKILAEAFRPKYDREEDGRVIKNDYAKPFGDLMPCPEELQIEAGYFGKGSAKDEEMQQLYASNKEKFGYAHWYDWQIASWGTKWDARVEDFQDDDPEEFYIYFETAWSPPIEFFRWFSEKYPDVSFENEYDEEGMSFEGKCSNSADCGFHDECWDIEEEEEEL
jgi:hypothetical protein